MPMSQNELEDLKYAKELLENPGLAARITDALGTAIDKGFVLLPAQGQRDVRGSGTSMKLCVSISRSLRAVKT